MKKKKPIRKLKRTKKISITLNDKEFAILNKYAKKYKYSNRSDAIRHIVFRHIFQDFENDYPELFPKK